MGQDPLHVLWVEPNFPGRLGAVADWLVRRRGYRSWFYCHTAEPRSIWPASVGKGLDLETLPLNTQLRIGTSANIRITGLRTPCVLIDRFKSGCKSRLLAEMPNPPFRAGVMAAVSEGGEVSPGDPISGMLPERPHLPLPPL